ncbi:MAG: amino acid adenylation domain-containing protein, partial [Burkholderiaceae bacterium]|nr:amino acid adenylation domain-containing protein [Burkholderiaceae bacterium]
ASLQSALAGLVERHEVLRSALGAHDGALRLQLLDAQQAAAALVLQPEALAAGQTPAQWLQAAAAEPFDLSRAPLLRARLLRSGPQEHVLLLCVHHAVADGWSMDVLVRELGALYEAHVQQRPSALPALPIQFADYACWLQQRLHGEHAQRELAYWRAALAELQPLQLPTDRPRPLRPTQHGAQHGFELDSELTAQLQALAQRENVTLFMLLLAAWQVLLMRYSGQHDLAVGSPVAGRPRSELEPLIGYFVNTLVLRADGSANPGFTTLLQQVRQTCVEAFAHQELPFERVVAELAPQRELGRNPLYQVCFALQNMPSSALQLGTALQVQRLALHADNAKFDLSLSITPTESSLRAALEYSTELFEPAFAQALARHYAQLLRSIVRAPETPLQQLQLLDAAERQLLLQGWNDTARDFPRTLNLAQLFEAQVQRSPEATALRLADGRTLSYAQLNARANRLAHALIQRGVGPDVPVGLCLPRGASMVVAMLAILKAGGAYVPLDPQYPTERLAFMLDDCACALLLTSSELLERLPHAGTPTLLLHPELDALASSGPHTASCDNPIHTAGPHHLAYVIYTSGSTGNPKGVAVEHAAVCNHHHWMNRVVGVTPDDRVLQLTSPNFDPSVWELFGPLMCGASLVLLPDGARADTSTVVRTMRDSAVTIICTVPAELAVMLEDPAIAQNTSLRWVNCGGEALERRFARRVRQTLPGATLVNCYGPTETCIIATTMIVDDQLDGPGSVPIGRPIDNLHCLVLDAQRHAVPPGAVGELYIGGAGLARGYLNRPELTAERFVEHPLCPGQRLYRTGDAVRRRHDGALEFVGRVDRQIKLNGVRIELGEIEAALTECGGVRQCAVVVREDTPGMRRLVGYVVGEAEAVIDTRAIGQQIASRLPAAMVPRTLVAMDALPLLPNGKVNRNALPAPNRSEAQTQDFQPRTVTEERLAELWGELLGAQRVGVEDNFFELGGHSLLATRLMMRVRRDFGCEAPLRW